MGFSKIFQTECLYTEPKLEIYTPTHPSFLPKSSPFCMGACTKSSFPFSQSTLKKISHTFSSPEYNLWSYLTSSRSQNGSNLVIEVLQMKLNCSWIDLKYSIQKQVSTNKCSKMTSRYLSNPNPNFSTEFWPFSNGFFSTATLASIHFSRFLFLLSSKSVFTFCMDCKNGVN